MRKILIIMLAFYSKNLISQSHDKLNGFGVNFAKFGYQYVGVDYIRKSSDNSHQFLIGVGVLNGVHNSNHQRNINDYDDRFMKSEDDVSKGFGFDLHWRTKFFDIKENWKLLGAIQYFQLNSKFEFTEYSYIYSPPYYHFEAFTYSEKLNRKTLGVNAILQFNPNVFFVEFEFGLGYNHIKIGENLAKYRNYQMNKFDYAYKGLVPLLGFRLGVFLF